MAYGVVRRGLPSGRAGCFERCHQAGKGVHDWLTVCAAQDTAAKCTSAAEMKPLPSLSKTLKASRSSSSESESCMHTPCQSHAMLLQCGGMGDGHRASQCEKHALHGRFSRAAGRGDAGLSTGTRQRTA